MKKNSYCVLFIIIASLFVGGCASQQTEMVRGVAVLGQADQLVSKLKEGGYVIYFQHAKTNPMERDTQSKDLEDCETQRKLSESGRTQARSIGEAFAAMSIPVSRVYASPYCRAMNTAKIAFGAVMKVSKAYDLKGIRYAERRESERRVNVLINMLSSIPQKTDKNTILVSHAENIKKAAGYSMNEGDALVVLPMEKEGFMVVALITAAQWGGMARTIGVRLN